MTARHPFPLAVRWNPVIGGQAWPSFVDHAITYFATHGEAHSYNVAEFVESDDEEDEGVLLLATDPYRKTERYRVWLSFAEENGRPIAIVWRIAKL